MVSADKNSSSLSNSGGKYLGGITDLILKHTVNSATLSGGSILVGKLIYSSFFLLITSEEEGER